MINLVFDLERVTVGDLMALEGGNLSVRWMAAFLARFACDENGQPLPAKEAARLVAEMTIPEMRRSVKRFWAALNEKAVNPTTDAP